MQERRTRRMTARRAAVLVVAVLVLLAGCTNIGGPAAPGDGDSDGNGGDAPGGDGGGGVTDGDASGDGFAAADREQVLRDAGSFTATWRYGGTGLDAETGELSVTHAVDLAGERSLTTWESSDGAETEGWQQFHVGGVTYTRYGAGDEAGYASAPGDTDLVATSLAYGGLYAATDTDDLVATSQETFDGVQVTRYELAERATVPWFAAGGAGSAGGADPDRLEEVDWTYTVLVDGDGLVRSESWGWTGTTADGGTATFESAYSITGVGSTTVDDPTWLDEATGSS
jgi:hypothetical protein